MNDLTYSFPSWDELLKWIENQKVFEVKIPDDFTWIKTYLDFIEKYSTKKWHLNWNYEWINLKLVQLAISINSRSIDNIDPVSFLIYLYYYKQLSLDSIKELLEKYWIDFWERKNFWRLLNTVFWWELRWNHTETPSKKEKDQKKARNLEIHSTRRIETQDEIDRILNLSIWTSFSIEEYKTKKTKKQNISYVLFSFWVIKKDNEENLKNFINDLQEKGFWARRIVEIITKIIKEKTNQDITIDSKEVFRWSK